ncbi:MAG TPA: ketoacyl-ACP synthase III [Myxococcales bacterium]|nr:ketoacyl-ACP synthase III [Myxococcales bacterium]
MTVSITGVGAYLPKRMLSNLDLPPLDAPLTAEELEKIGVDRRGWASEAEGIAEMAAEAAQLALARAGLDASELDLIVLSNWTRRRYIPEFAPRLQALLGAHQSVAFDLCCACAGFLYGLGIAHSFFQGGRFSKALVVGSETTSRRARPGSKGTVILGDAAGAMVLQQDAGRGGRLLDYELATKGAQHHIMDISDEGYVRTHITQGELNQLAATSIAGVAGKLLARNNLTLADIDWIVPHSGTAGVQRSLVKALNLPPAKVLTNYAQVGNVSSASIPTALQQFVAEGLIKPGQLILSAAVGTGWYAAGALYSL